MSILMLSFDQRPNQMPRLLMQGSLFGQPYFSSHRNIEFLVYRNQIMLSSNIESKIRSDQRLRTRQSKQLHHQEIVFGDSKFIFYDSTISEPILKKINSGKRASIYKKIGPSSTSNSFSRPLTTIAKQRSKMMGKKMKNKENIRQSKEANKINLVFNQLQTGTKNEDLGNEIASKNSSRLLKSNQKTKSIHSTKRSETQIPILNLSPMERSSKFKTCISLEKSKVKNQSQEKDVKLNESKTQKNVIENKQSPLQNAKIDATDQQNEDQIKEVKHDQIKLFFGSHHKLFMTNRDYLSLYNDRKSQSGSCSYLKSCVSGKQQYFQKKLEKQLSQLKVASCRPIKNCTEENFSKIQNNSMVSHGSKSGLNTNSFLAQTGMYRAPILLYLKNAETKKLYNIIIQNSKEKQRFVDRQFSHEGIQKIDGQNVEWVYIEPNPNVPLFPIDQDDRLFFVDQQTETQKFPLDFVNFLKGLYYYEPDLIKRLFEPPVNNLYSVWLFLNGCFEPVFVDGYFPLDSQLNHFYGSSAEYLWLPILIKCICKVYNTLSRQKLKQIKLSQIYCMLTGMPLPKIQHQEISHMPGAELSKLIVKQTENGYDCLVHLEKHNSILVVCDQSKPQVTLLNPNNGQRHSMEAVDKKHLSVIAIPEFTNQFIYNFRANESSLSKFQVNCPRNTEAIFSVSGILQNKETRPKRIYIYECEGFGKNNCKMKLILREEAEIKDIYRLKLRKGSYKVFVEDGEKKIHLLLTGKNIVKWEEKTAACSQFCISLFASHQLKLSQMEQLQKKGNYLEDSSNIYQDCTSRRYDQHQ